MKKNLWFAALALAAMTSCSNDEVMDVADNRAIEFKSFVNKGSRAVENDVVDITNDGNNAIKSFWVYGEYQNNKAWVDVFTNVAVTKSGANWTYGNTVYWEANKTYNFGAYANGADQTNIENTKLHDVSFTSTSATDAKLTFTNYSVGDGTKDLVAAIATDKSWDGTGEPNAVGLTFNHLLSKVKFTFTTTDSPEAYKFTVSKLKIARALTKATGSYNGTASWEKTGTTGDYVYDGIGDYAVPKGGSEPSVYRYVIPQNNSNLYATFTVTAFDAANNQLATANFKANLKYTKDQAEDTANGEWTPGFVYNYTAVINYKEITEVDPNKPTAKPIVFEANVEGWDDADGTKPTPESSETQPKP